MGKKVFVGGLPWAIDDQELANVFKQVGAVVEAKVITDRETGRSRGFGFVTFASEDAVPLAIKEFDGAELQGRRINVNEAQERSGGGGGPRHSGGGGGHQQAPRGGNSGGGRRDRDEGRRGRRREHDDW